MSPVASITLNGPACVMVPTQVAGSKRTVGCPALWSMRKLPPAKVAPSMARPGFSVPPALPGAGVDGSAPGPQPPAAGGQPPAAGPGHPVCEDQVDIGDVVVDALVALAGEATATATKAVPAAAAARMAA